eukprot:COSAG01_NODE_64648_length_275_cov_26.017045_1_plen_62_part_01
MKALASPAPSAQPRSPESTTGGLLIGIGLLHVWRSSLVRAAKRFQLDFLKKIFQQTNTVVFV